MDISMMKHTEFLAFVNRARQKSDDDTNQDEFSVFAASVHDINKMLEPKKNTHERSNLSEF